MTLKLTNKSFFSISNLWVTILILSFSFDKAVLILFSADRFNLRILDLSLVLGVIWFLKKGVKTRLHNPIFDSYKKVIYVFVFAVFLSLLVYDFPLSISSYSVYYLFKYFKELVIFYLFLIFLRKYKINYDAFLNILLIGGLFVSFYCLFEYLDTSSDLIEYVPGKFTSKPVGYVWGPFTVSYFQISNYSPIIGFLLFNHALNSSNKINFLFLFSSFLVFLPSFFCGSRTALGLLFLILIISAFKNPKNRLFLFLFFCLSLVILFFNYEYFSKILFENNQTIERFSRMETDEKLKFNSVIGRLNHIFLWFSLIKDYEFSGILMPIFGAGFYVAPMKEIFRIGFGWHNIFIFAFEQAGFFGLIYFLKFCKKSYNVLFKVNYFLPRGASKTLLDSIKIIFISILISGIFGAHTFWLGFSTGNFNTFRVLLLIIAAHIIFYNTSIKDAKDRTY